VLGPEKRRRRTTQEKIAIVQQSFEPGMTVSLVARQHDVAASYFSGASNTRREVLLR
ncbi:putative insertion sequence 2 OrfA protein, partial [Escherichia coli MS 200-1]